MPVISRFIHTEAELGVEIRIWRKQRGAQHQDIWPWLRMVCRSESLLQKVPQRIVNKLKPWKKTGMKAVIPPRKNRKIQREYDKELYKLRHWVENTFLTLKRWRGIATRYAKNTASFLAAVQIRCIAAWILNNWRYDLTIHIYLRRGSCCGFLNLGLAPNRDGCFASCDVARFREWKQAINTLFTKTVLQTEIILANGEGLVKFQQELEFNLLELTKPMDDGEKIWGYEVLVRFGGNFKPLISGKGVRRRRLKRLQEWSKAMASDPHTGLSFTRFDTSCYLLCCRVSESKRNFEFALRFP